MLTEKLDCVCAARSTSIEPQTLLNDNTIDDSKLPPECREEDGALSHMTAPSNDRTRVPDHRRLSRSVSHQTTLQGPGRTRTRVPCSFPTLPYPSLPPDRPVSSISPHLHRVFSATPFVATTRLQGTQRDLIIVSRFFCVFSRSRSSSLALIKQISS